MDFVFVIDMISKEKKPIDLSYKFAWRWSRQNLMLV